MTSTAASGASAWVRRLPFGVVGVGSAAMPSSLVRNTHGRMNALSASTLFASKPSGARMMSGKSDAMAATPFWNAFASSYDNSVVHHFTVRSAKYMLDRFHDKPTDAILDVGCGTGTLLLELATRFPDVKIVGTDYSADMLTVAEEKVKAAGLSNVELVEADGMALPEEWTGRFDAAFSAFAVIFFPDRVQGFREMRRVLKPGGLAGVTSWAPQRDCSALNTMYEAVDDTLAIIQSQADPGDPAVADAIAARAARIAAGELPPGPPLLFTLSHSPQFKNEMKAGGFETARVGRMSLNFEGDLEAYLAGMSVMPVSLPPLNGSKEQTHVELMAALRRRATPKFFEGGANDMVCCVNLGVGFA